MVHVKLATCSLNQWAMDFEGNLDRILQSIKEAKRQNARYRLGPELEVSGYGCEDHFLEIDTFHHSAEVLAKILESDATYGILTDIGMPILHNTVPYNCRVFCLDGKILCIRPKIFLADDGNYREPRWFTAWTKEGEIEDHTLEPCIQLVTGQRFVPFGDCCLQTRETKIASETCEELFTPDSPHIRLGLAGVEIFSNASGSHHSLRKLHRRIDLIRSATEKSGGVYLYANQFGCDGGRLLFDGCAMIAVNGDVVAQGDQFALNDVQVVTATIDLDAIRAFRISKASRGVQASRSPGLPVIPVDFYLSDRAKFGTPSTPVEVKYLLPEEEIAYGPARWLWDYLRRSGASGFFLPLSGGADSSSTATIVGAMCRMVVKSIDDPVILADIRKMTGDPQYTPKCSKELAQRLLHTAYLGTSNSSEGTKQFSAQLAKEIGSYHLYANIDSVISAILSLFSMVTGQTPKYRVYGGTHAENQALQNIQARFRMLFSYMLAQLLPWVRGNPGWLLVLGSGNVDEGLRGYLTKYDCSSADLNPIGGISKVDLKRFLLWASTNLDYPVLKGIVAQPPTAELEPITDQYTQQDEADMGMTYEELGWFGRLRKIERCGPFSMFQRLLSVWPQLSAQEISRKVKHFFTTYAQNRHKATTLTPSVHCESYGVDDNRFDLRPIIINWRWPWQFRKIDNLVEHIEHDKSRL